MTLSPGEKLGPYEILSAIGAGGMGEVYKARDTKLDREVAIKVLPAALAGDSERLARFDREAKVLASLNHPHIAQIYGLVESPHAALVMELVPGRTLQGPLPLHEALGIAAELAGALEAAHDRGIIHRDLKPANIMITPDGAVKVLDFGLAAIAQPASSENPENSPTLTMRATQAGFIMGTAGYMSPEQAAGKTVDKRADIWAFGVVLHELLTGKRLFGGETVSHTLASVLKDPIDFAIPQAPAPIQALLARCLDRNLKHRLRDIGEARIAIEDFLANPDASPEPSKATPSRPILWMAISAVLLIGLVAAIAMLWLRSSPPAAVVSHFIVPTSPPNVLLVSPDGRWFLKKAPDAFYLRPLDRPDWRKVAGTEGAQTATVFWAPDSSAFGFVLAGRLRLASLDGSPPRDLLEVHNFLGASWHGTREDGAILLAINGKLRTLDLRSGKVQDLPLAFKAGSPPSAPAFLPEGDGFVFLQDLGGGKRLYRSAVNSSAVNPLFLTTHGVQFAKHPATGNWHVFYLAGEPELQSSRILRTAPIDPQTGLFLAAPVKLLQGASVAPSVPPYARISVGNRGVLSWRYSSNSLPIWRLAWTDLAGNLLARISEPRTYGSLALSPDESRIAAQVHDPDSHIWILDSKTGLGGRLTNSPEPENYPYWAPDGKSIYYVARTADASEIRRSFLDDASRPEVLWRSDSVGQSSLAGISADGRYVLLQLRTGSLYRLDLESKPPRKIELLEERTAGRPGWVSLSPDGRTLVWGTPGPGLDLEAYPPSAGSIRRFSRGNEFIDKPFFGADGRSLYALFQGNLVMFPLAPDRGIGELRFLRPWTTTTLAGAAGGVASRDGERLLLIETDQAENLDFQVLTDWTTLLPK